MKLIKYFLLVIISSACLAQKPELINNSNTDLVSESHFNECIVASDYALLLDKKSKKEKVYFEYFPSVKSKTGCDGIYYYNYVSRSFPKPLYRDKSGKTYSKYFLFMILNGEIVSITGKSEKSRKRFFDKHQVQLEETFGKNKIQELKPEIINGFKKHY
ncbi:MAG: hypothetical protein AAGF85_07500 [Bacteroidota bacterium]